MLNIKLTNLLTFGRAMAQSESDEDYDPGKEKKLKRKKVNNKARTSHRRQKRKEKQDAKKQKMLKQKQIRKQKQDAKEQEKLKQQQIRKAEEEKWNNMTLQDMRKVNEIPPKWFVKRWEHDPRAAVWLWYLILPPPEDTRRPPVFNWPVPDPQACEPCAMVAVAKILEPLRTKPRTMSLNYNSVYQKVETKGTGYFRGLKHFEEAGFTHQHRLPRNRLLWENTAQNRLALANVADGFDVVNQVARFTYNDDGTHSDTGLCEHWKDKLEPLTCGRCSIHLVKLIVNGLADKRSESEFCALDYAHTKAMLIGYCAGLSMLYHIGFLRSQDGLRYFWKEDATANAAIKECRESFAAQPICDCELTTDKIAVITSAEMQEEDKNDVRPNKAHLVENAVEAPIWQENGVEMTQAKFRAEIFRLPTPDSTWNEREEDETETSTQDEMSVD